MRIAPLPPEVSECLERLKASPRLIAHLRVVHDVSCQLTEQLDSIWPNLPYDRSAVHLGAALHDIGKVKYPHELQETGHAHEAEGEALLRRHGFPPTIARFARTHKQWDGLPEPQAEDMLVALADKGWRGKRDDKLEMAVSRWIGQQVQLPEWQVFMKLDDIMTAIAVAAEARLEWQRHAEI